MPQKLSTLTIAKCTTFTRINIMLHTRVKHLRATSMCSIFNPDFCSENSIIEFIGNVHCPNKACLGNSACTERLSSLSAAAIINIQVARPRANCAMFLLIFKQTRIPCCVIKGFTFLMSHKNQFETLLEMSFVLAGIVPDKSVSTSKHEKRTLKAVTNVRKAKRAVTFWLIYLRTKSRQ